MKITVKTENKKTTIEGFRFVREDSVNCVLQHPNGDYNTIPKGNYTTLADYAENIDTPFKYDEDGERVFYSEPFYLDYFNDWLTVKAMAEHYHITESQANILIEAGREENHKRQAKK